MTHLIFRQSVRSRVLASRLGSLLMLFQRSPLVQMIFPEAKVIGGAGLGEFAKWSVATVAGLGAFDAVAGATTIAQVAPNAGSSTVTATQGKNLVFVFQLTNYPDTPGSWRVTGLPAGLVHADAKNNSISSVTGAPTQAGTFPVRVTAYQKDNYSGDSFSKTFSLNVVGLAAPEIVVEQPLGTSLVDGSARRGFGTAKIGTKGKTSTFTIKNTGQASLTGISIAKTGIHAKAFAITPLTRLSLPPGTSTTFKVTFKPTTKGFSNAAIHIRSNDQDENPFSILVTGLGVR